MKLSHNRSGISTVGRSPHGERGLKLGKLSVEVILRQSLPSRGAWIEIIKKRNTAVQRVWSLPSRGAWIEMPPDTPGSTFPPVAPLTGSVD